MTFSPSRGSLTLPIQVCRLVLRVLVRLGREFFSLEGVFVGRGRFGMLIFCDVRVVLIIAGLVVLTILTGRGC